MTTYYISSATGNDSRAGTSKTSAFKTFRPINDLIRKGIINPGDIIYLDSAAPFLADATNNTTKYNTSLRPQNNVNSSGTATKPVVVTSYGSGRAIFHGNKQDMPLLAAFTGNIPVDYWHFIGLEFTHTLDSQSFQVQNGVTGWLVDDCYFHDTHVDYGGLHFGGGVSQCVVKNCTFDNLAGEGVYLGKSGHTHPGFIDKDILVEDNTFINCDGEAIEIKADTRNIQILNNTIKRCGSYGTAQIQVGGNDHLIRGNIIRGVRANTKAGIKLAYWQDAEGGRCGADNIVVEGNLLDNCDGNEGAIWVRGKNCKIINNTVVNNSIGLRLNYEAESTVTPAHAQHIIRNNAFCHNIVAVKVDKPETSKYTSDYNGYHANTNDWDWHGNIGLNFVRSLSYEGNAVAADPKFVDTTNFELQNSSPYLNAGDTTYRLQTFRANKPDIGWKERPYTVIFTTNGVSGANDDARQRVTGEVETGLQQGRVEYVSSDWLGFIFRGMNIPADATITSAELQIYSHDTAFQKLAYTVYGEATANPTPFSATAENISRRVLTTTSVSWEGMGNGVGYVASPDLSGLIQELLSFGGNDFSLLVQAQSGVDHKFRQWDYQDGAFAPQLIVTYTISKTMTVRVTGGNDDARQRITGEIETDLQQGRIEYISSDWLGFIFRGVNIPTGAIITTAELQIYCQEEAAQTLAYTVYGEATDHPTPFTKTTQDISQRALTTTSVSWAGTGNGSDYIASPDLSGLIQEVLSFGGQDLALLVQAQGGVDHKFRQWDYQDGAFAPQLLLTYTF
jgi:hypothetical protein